MLSSSAARADLPAGCAELGFALTEHSCFHATFGPYATVTAAPGVPAAAAAPRVDDVHTYHDVVLPNPTGQNTVSYKVSSASRSGAWAIFHDARVPIRVVSESGQEQPVVLSHDVASCTFLPRVDVFELGFERYRVVLGPTNVTRSVLVIENISDFMRHNGRDLDGDGYGDVADAVITACVPAAGYVQNASDCDDTNPAIHPGAVEVCDGIDQNCNGVVDDVGLPCTSGQGQCRASGTTQCLASQAPAVCSAVASAPGVETCDGVDEDCDGVPDVLEPGLCAHPDAPTCVLVLGATRCGCDADSDCGGPTSERVCDLDARRCVTGCVALPGRNACPAGLVCTSADPANPGTCVPPTSGCTDDAGCAATPLTPRCLVPPGQLGRCVECVDDLSCGSRGDRRTACIGPDHRCAECTAEDTSRCDATERGSACLPSGLCGCTDDGECESGACDLARGACSPADAEPAGEDGEPAPADACGCRALGARADGARGAWLVVALAAVFRRRRLGRAAAPAIVSAALIAFAGCGGRMEEVTEPSTTTPPSNVPDRGVEGGPAPDAAVADADPPDACVPELGSKVVGHACSHGTHGPFESVVAADGAASAAPAVNVVHRTYEVVMPSASPPWSGAVGYAPSRDGRHAIFTAPLVGLRIFSGDAEVSAVHRQDVSDAACAALDQAVVAPLAKGQPVRIELSDSPEREVKLFIEHLGTFDGDAWASSCAP